MKKLLFIFTSLVTISILLLEVFTYKNILFKHFYISSDLLFVVSLFFVWTSLNSDNKGSAIVDVIASYFLVFIKYLTIPLSISYLYFIFLNINNYPNYVFSTYHLQPDLMSRPLLYSLCVIFLSYIRKRSLLFKQTLNYVKDPMKQTESIFMLVLVVTLFSYGIFNLTKNISTLSPYVLLSIKNLNKSEEEKRDVMMKLKYGYFYDYLKFIIQIVPEESSILLPPQKNPWQNEGNQRLSRYFLYPRNIYSAHEKDLPDDIEFIEIAWGSNDFAPDSDNDYGWPKEKIKASKVYIYNFNTKTIDEHEGDYDPEKYLKPGVYGLIKTI